MPKGCVRNISCNALYERKIRKELYVVDNIIRIIGNIDHVGSE